ncbi:MAG: phage major capsid protein, partial [Actinomycetia bacterium]|nr:phage major capsid protein [Actinomycetes bacterium]
TAEETVVEGRLNTAIDEALDHAERGNAYLGRERAADEARAQYENLQTEHRDDDGPADDLATREAEAVRQLAAGETRAIEFETRDLTAGTATDGAELVPQSMYQQIHGFMQAASSVMLGGATQIRTAGGEAITVPKVTSYSAATLVAEAGAIGESDPQFDTVTLDAYKYAFLAQVSTELLQDSAFDVAGWLARHGGTALGRGINAAFVTGTGSSQPNGVDNVTSGVTAAAVAAITGNELIDLQESVTAEYHGASAFMMKQSTRKLIRKLVDSNGQYIWQPALTAGEPSTLLGSPLYTDDAMATAAASAVSVIYGDLAGYYARFAGPVRVERSDDFAFANDLVTFRFIQRADGDIVDTVGTRALTQAAS